MSLDGTILLNGLSSENVKSSIPRSDPNYADQKTDIFALGSAMMTGHEPFPELDPFDDDEAESKIQIWPVSWFRCLPRGPHCS